MRLTPTTPTAPTTPTFGVRRLAFRVPRLAVCQIGGENDSSENRPDKYRPEIAIQRNKRQLPSAERQTPNAER